MTDHATPVTRRSLRAAERAAHRSPWARRLGLGAPARGRHADPRPPTGLLVPLARVTVCALVVAGGVGHTQVLRTEHADKVDGVKVSLLDDQREIDMRRRLPKGVRMYTGDDFNYPDLIKGDEQGYSDALLGIFDAIAPVAGAAFAALDEGDLQRYDELFGPTVPLSRHIFKAPTRFYKTGVVFLAWLNGHQDHFRMVNGQESCRSVVHLSELFRLADEARLFTDTERVTARMRAFLEVAGVPQ